MEIQITIKDTENGQVEIEEVRLPYSGETLESVTTASALADELNNNIQKLGEVNACGVPVLDDENGEWEMF